MFSYEAFSEATMLTDDFSTSGLAEDWFESECIVFNSFAAWMSESLDSIKWQVAVLLWTNGIHNNKWLLWGAREYTKYSTDLETWQVFLRKYWYVYLVHKMTLAKMWLFDIIGNGDLFYQSVYMCSCLWVILLWNVLMLNNVYLFLKILTNIN